jgi:hypothetical protein
MSGSNRAMVDLRVSADPSSTTETAGNLALSLDQFWRFRRPLGRPWVRFVICGERATRDDRDDLESAVASGPS